MKYPLLYHFPIEKPKLPNLTLPQNRSRSLQGHHLNKLLWTVVPNATYQVPWKLSNRLWCRRFLKGFTIYGCGGHHGHMTWTIYTNFGSPFPRRLHINLALIGLVVSEEKTFEIVNRRTTTTDLGYHISSPLSLWLR